MKKFIAIIAAACSLVSMVSCQEKLPDGADTTSLRVALTPAPDVFPAEGGVVAAGCVVNEGVTANVDWTVTIDGNPSWITVEKIDYTSQFIGTYEGDDRDVTTPGVRINVSANMTKVKRTAYLRFSVEDGGSVSYAISQAKGE